MWVWLEMNDYGCKVAKACSHVKKAANISDAVQASKV